MSGWRRQLPVYSPLPATALLEGARAAAGPARRQSARQQLIRLLRARYAPLAVLLSDSGTTALTAALIGILRNRPGFAIALPAFGCYDLATAARGADALVFLYDVDPHTLAPDLESLGAVLRYGVAAVVVVHPYGYPLDLGEVKRLAAQTGAVVVEDAAQAAGARLDGRPAGGMGSLVVLSFGRGKGLTGGGGGALLAHDAAGARVLERARRLLRKPHQGWSDMAALVAQWSLARPNVYALPAAFPFLRLGDTVYREPRPLREPTATACAVVTATWASAEREVEVRRRHAERLLSELWGVQGFETIGAASHAQPGYLRLPFLASPSVRRAVSSGTARRQGVMPGYPKALCDLEEFFPRCLNRDAPFRGSRHLAAQLCTLPTHSQLDDRDLTRLGQWIRAVGGR